MEDKIGVTNTEPEINRPRSGITSAGSDDDDANAPDSIRLNRDFDSNRIDESDSQSREQNSSRYSAC
jgi:hypothetical protein